MGFEALIPLHVFIDLEKAPLSYNVQLKSWGFLRYSWISLNSPIFTTLHFQQIGRLTVLASSDFLLSGYSRSLGHFIRCWLLLNGRINSRCQCVDVLTLSYLRPFTTSKSWSAWSEKLMEICLYLVFCLFRYHTCTYMGGDS